MSILTICISVYRVPVVLGGQKGVRVPGPRLTCNYEPPCRCYESSQDLLLEQKVFLLLSLLSSPKVIFFLNFKCRRGMRPVIHRGHQM